MYIYLTEIQQNFVLMFQLRVTSPRDWQVTGIFWNSFDQLLINISHFESHFLQVVLFGTLIIVHSWVVCVNLLSIGLKNGHHWQINFLSIRHHDKDLSQFDFSKQPFERHMLKYCFQCQPCIRSRFKCLRNFDVEASFLISIDKSDCVAHFLYVTI